jgi:hypothetical protein
MNRIMVCLFTVACLLLVARCASADEPKHDKKSYYQYNPNSVQQPATIWNPIITEKKDGKVSKSYYQFNPTPVLPAGTMWNPLVTEKKK